MYVSSLALRHHGDSFSSNDQNSWLLHRYFSFGNHLLWNCWSPLKFGMQDLIQWFEVRVGINSKTCSLLLFSAAALGSCWCSPPPRFTPTMSYPLMLRKLGERTPQPVVVCGPGWEGGILCGWGGNSALGKVWRQPCHARAAGRAAGEPGTASYSCPCGYSSVMASGSVPSSVTVL